MRSEHGRAPAPWRTAALVLACFALYLLMNYLMLSNVLMQFGERGARVSFVYLAWIVCGFVVFFVLLVTSGPRLLALVLPFFLVSLSTNYAYIKLGKRALSFEVMEWLPQEMRQLPNAWREFPTDIGLAIAKAMLALALFLLLRATIRRHAGAWRSSARMRIAALFAFTAFHGAAMALQPPQMMAETNLFVFGVPALFSSPPDLRPVTVVPQRPAIVEKVLLVVDESVTYAAYRDSIAPVLRHTHAIDFGEAASTANCSAPSNALLRWGIERPHLGDAAYDPRTNPSIWAYAKAAGLRTVLIDGQSSGAMQNYLGPREFALIDEFVPAYAGLETDMRIAGLLREHLERPGAEFIYVVKDGTHFPYERNYPRGMAAEDAPRAVKYRTAVSYESGRFFEQLARDLPLSRLLLIYTSDHGQALEGGSTHCNPEPEASEYSVPLVAFTDSPALKSLLGDGTRMRDRASHLNIFPTLLYAFGYSRDWTEGLYGHTLAGPPSAYITYVNLGWNTKVSRDKRQTVDTRRFVQSEMFPRRTAAK